MSEERLTVAELLARAEKRGEGAARSDRPRRRRRSLEDGGVSVAELTGSIPKVRADGPRRGAHAAPDELEETTVETPAEDAAAAPADVAAEAPADVEAEAPVEAAAEVEAEAPAEAPAYDVADDAAPAVAEAPAVDEAHEFDAEAETDIEAETDFDAAPDIESEAEVADDGRAPMAVPAAVPLDPRPVMANDDRDEVTFTFTKLHDADTGSWPVAEAGPVAREVLEGSQSLDDRPTAVLPVIEESAQETAPVIRHPEPEEFVRESDGYDDADAFDGSPVAGEYVEADFGDAPEADYGDDGYRDDVDHWDTAGALSDEREVDEYAARAREEEEYARGDEDLDEADDGFDGRDAAALAPAESGTAKKKLRRTKKGQLEDDSLSIGLLIAQTIVGLILGALAFVLFNFLWSALPIAVCVVIALVFTFLLVIGVNMVRREKDAITPVLAGIVGLAVSFSPWLLTMM